jgi:4-amino-4-deoxy-L-arabinose transferase-like glycosyltransferase
LWWAERRLARTPESDREHQFGVFACCWLILPVLFFSISQSKLPGYILPAIPGGALLLADYLRRHLKQSDAKPTTTGLVVLHALLAGGLIIPALLIAYLVTQHRLPGGQPMLVALAVAFVLCAGIALTLIRKGGLRMLRFVTLIPVVLTVGAVLRLGAVPLDQTLSARPLALEISGIETRPLPLAVYHVRRELEYGLTFYRNQATFNYDWGSVPREEHLLVAPENSQVEIAKLVPGRRVSYLGHYPAQRVDYYWVAAAGAATLH